jgi:hypothetical protein
MTETTKQRWLIGVVGVGALVVGLLTLSDVEPSDRLVAVILLVLSGVLGIVLMWLRDIYLRRTGKLPSDKPSGDRMNALILASVGVVMVIRALLSPQLLVAFYGALAGLCAGAFIFIRKDLERLGKV